MNRYFHVLGLTYPSDVSDKVIKEAYYKLAKAYHPDAASGGDAARFRQISDAYEAIKDKHRRAEVQALSVDDDAFHRRQRGSPGDRAANAAQDAYERNYRTVESEFASAEDKFRAQNRRAFAFMSTFERLIHPRVLFVLVPLTVLGYCALSTASKRLYTHVFAADASAPGAAQAGSPAKAASASTNKADQRVDCWLNPATNKLEAAAPWNADYRAAVARGDIRREERSKVTPSQQR